MSFLSPAFLWGFALLAPLIAVYLLKVRPRRHPVTAIFLWDEIFTQRKATSLLQRLRDLISLLLLALAAAALIFAAARPQFTTGDDHDVLLLIDRSASMSADADGPGRSRFDAAIDRAEALIRGIGGERRLAIATVDDRIDYATFLTAEPRRLRDALQTLTPGQGPSADLPLDELRRVAGLSEDLRVVLLTDGVGLNPPPATDDPTVPSIETIRIGRPAAPGNVGFTAADLVAVGNNNLTLFFAITSSFTESLEAEATLTDADQRVVKVIPLNLTPGPNPPQVYRVNAGPGRYTLALRRTNGPAEDALSLDDTATLNVPASRPLRVAVDAADRYFLETAVNAFAQSGGLMTLVESGQPADLTLARGVAPQNDVAPNLRVIFAPEMPEVPGGAVASVGPPLTTGVLPRVLLPQHPVLRHLPAESLAFAGAREVTPAAGSAVLVADLTGTALIWQHRDPDSGVATLVINLDPAAADFVLSPFFPVLIHAAATHLGGRATPPRSTYATADRAAVPGLGPGQSTQLQTPNAQTLTVAAGDRVRLDQAGVYRGDRNDQSLAVSVLHPAETQLASSLPDELADVTLPAGHPPWLWLTLVALAIVIAEEVLYHRRKVG